MLKGIKDGRGGKGSLFVFASGNGGANDDNCNFDGYTNSMYTITVGAVDRLFAHPYYAEKCSALLVTTYSSGSGSYIVNIFIFFYLLWFITLHNLIHLSSSILLTLDHISVPVCTGVPQLLPQLLPEFMLLSYRSGKISL
jgi:hypothetical protein